MGGDANRHGLRAPDHPNYGGSVILVRHSQDRGWRGTFKRLVPKKIANSAQVRVTRPLTRKNFFIHDSHTLHNLWKRILLKTKGKYALSKSVALERQAHDQQALFLSGLTKLLRELTRARI